MAVSDIIAMYAALVGTGAAAWPVWQARKARRPDVEVALFFTRIWNEVSEENYRCLFLEARNRGDHPIRVMTAGVSNGRINYTFMPDRIDVYKKGAAFPHAGISYDSPRPESSAVPMLPPIPGIILPRDAGSRMLPEGATKALVAHSMKLRSEGEEGLQGLRAGFTTAASRCRSAHRPDAGTSWAKCWNLVGDAGASGR